MIRVLVIDDQRIAREYMENIVRTMAAAMALMRLECCASYFQT